MSEDSRGQIEQWLCMKQEFDDCFADETTIAGQEKPRRSLEPIDEVNESEDKTSTRRSFGSETYDDDSDAFDDDLSSFNLNADLKRYEKGKEFADIMEAHVARFRNMTDCIVYENLVSKFIDSTGDTNKPLLVERKSVNSCRTRWSILPCEMLLQSAVNMERPTQRENARTRTTNFNYKLLAPSHSDDACKPPPLLDDRPAKPLSAEEPPQSVPQNEARNLTKAVCVKPKSALLRCEVESADAGVLRQEIIKLRATRDYFMDQKRSLDIKLSEKNLFTANEERRFIQFDEAIEAIDSVMEFKNQLMCGHTALGRSDISEKEEDMLNDRLLNLSEMEMRSLLGKYFKKVVDLREAGRQLEQRIAEQDYQMERQSWKIFSLGNALQAARIDNEKQKQLVLVCREHEEKMRIALDQSRACIDAGDTSVSSLNGLRVEGPCLNTSVVACPAGAIAVNQSIKKKLGSTTKVTVEKNKLVIQKKRSKKY